MAIASTDIEAVKGHDTCFRRISILGSTGSVGCSTLDLVERNAARYAVEALTANRNVEGLIEQALRVRPNFVVIADDSKYAILKDALAGTGIETAAGEAALHEAAERPSDWVMAAIVGAAGLGPTLAAARRGAVVALANKECLVCAGPIFLDAVTRGNATLLPVDSEHNAIYQVLDSAQPDAIDKIVLTASGGPFRTATLDTMRAATPAEAVAHPNWDMGAKISVDSATMMNKGLELIEAHYLFGLPEERIDILVHPQSVIHSMVAYVDGSVLAQLGSPDMRIPIAYTLAWPRRMGTPATPLDLATIGQLTFERPDDVRFPSLRLAREALGAGGLAPTVLNAANEVAVAAFLDGEIGFLKIADVVADTLEACTKERVNAVAALEDVITIDGHARREAGERVARARP